MSILTQMVLIEKHGLRVDLEALAGILDMKPSTIRNQISAHVFQLPTYTDGGKRWADVRDVAEYLDSCRQQARQAHGAGLPA